jgi:hypothetical protein
MITAFAESVHIALPAATLFHVGPLPFTNTMLMGAIGVIVMVAVLLYARHNVKRGKHTFVTGLVQWHPSTWYW